MCIDYFTKQEVLEKCSTKELIDELNSRNDYKSISPKRFIDLLLDNKIEEALEELDYISDFNLSVEYRTQIRSKFNNVK